MNSDRLNKWVQTATGLAIVVGLGLVIWELQWPEKQPDLKAAFCCSAGYFHTPFPRWSVPRSRVSGQQLEAAFSL